MALIKASLAARQSRRPGYMFSASIRALVAAQMVERDGYSITHASGATCVNPAYVRAVLHADPEVRRRLGAGRLRLVDLFQGYCTERRRHQASEAKAQAQAEAEARAKAQAEAEAEKVKSQIDRVCDAVGVLPVVARIIARFNVDFLLGAADAALQARGQDLVEVAFNLFETERVTRVLDKLTTPHQSSAE